MTSRYIALLTECELSGGARL